MMKLPIYQRFGSPSSQDIDVVFFVDQLGEIKHSSTQAKLYGETLAEQMQASNEVNANLAVVHQEGYLTQVYKGTTDELNNALLYTYQHHEQQYPLQVTEVLPRDIDLKILRCARVVLSFLSRTKLRNEVKAALRGDLTQKLQVLASIQLSEFSQLGKHGGLVAFYKTAAFQLGQTLALADGLEFYTKENIAAHYPELAPYLFRKAGVEVEMLQHYLRKFIDVVNVYLPSMKSLYEYTYTIQQK